MGGIITSLINVGSTVFWHSFCDRGYGLARKDSKAAFIIPILSGTVVGFKSIIFFSLSSFPAFLDFLDFLDFFPLFLGLGGRLLPADFDFLSISAVVGFTHFPNSITGVSFGGISLFTTSRGGNGGN